MEKDSKEQQFICNHCFCNVEEDAEKMVCPACGNFYHEKCWENNYGCAVISCSQKNILLNPFFQSSVPVRDLLTHIEYYINIRKYDEALTECRRILNIDSGNLDARVFYNRAVSMMKTRDRILESAEESYSKKQFKASALFYKEYLNYCDDEERKFIDSKIKYLEELLPSMRRKNAVVYVLYAFIVLLILASAGFYLYRFYYLKEDTDFADIEKYDDYENVKIMESQILNYENFLAEYPDGKMKEKARQKIADLSSVLASGIAKDDWRVALIFLKKINKEQYPKTYSDVEKLVFDCAKSEINALVSEARNLDKHYNYDEAKQKIDKCLAIIDNFSSGDRNYDRKRFADTRNILMKKSGLRVKLNEIESEISKNESILKEIAPDAELSDFVSYFCRIIKREKKDYIVKSLDNRKLYSVRGLPQDYQPGEELEIRGIIHEKVRIIDDAGNEIYIPLIISEYRGSDGFYSDEKAIILKKLDYLRSQKERIDSTLKTGIL
ncbi:MAG: hypothetical protein MUE56_03910 [Ignavibacteria bacterium]|jgi:hypothetical protein|nr:hypothetical protein [Ignavibacteria bacterium]